MVSPQQMDGKALPPEGEDHVQELPAARSAVHVIPQKIKVVPWVQHDDFFQKRAKGACTAMNVRYYEAARSHSIAPIWMKCFYDTRKTAAWKRIIQDNCDSK
jgi:hypothetical protein